MFNLARLGIAAAAVLTVAAVVIGPLAYRPTGVGQPGSVPSHQPASPSLSAAAEGSFGTRDELVHYFESLGFEGRDRPLTDGTPRWTGRRALDRQMSPDPYNVEAADVLGAPRVHTVRLSFYTTYDDADLEGPVAVEFLDAFAPELTDFYRSVLEAAVSDPDQEQTRTIAGRTIRVSTSFDNLVNVHIEHRPQGTGPTVSGTVVLRTGMKTVANGTVVACRGTGPNADVTAGTLISIHEKRTDAVIATSELVVAGDQPARGCALSYAVPGLTDEAMYSIRVEGRPFGLTYTHGALAAARWVAEPLVLD
jgi:hypothetical protein